MSLVKLRNAVRERRAGLSFAVSALPSGIIDRLALQDRAQVKASGHIKLDGSENIERARRLLRQLAGRGDVAVEGQGGNDRTYQLAADILNLGHTTECVTVLIAEERNPHYEPPCSHRRSWRASSRTPANAQNEPGA